VLVEIHSGVNLQDDALLRTCIVTVLREKVMAASFVSAQNS